ncbi:MBL fold metallo-hydrolase [Pseudovibrio sp. Alg231-02]|uniref:MBL fold metallo-hydrolase n=1 Tax=Pseudovibrio sp. Alg231-02 TaxID=1922223 RepID=UPI000D54CAE9|nr:MBL fold metallo-hydrolase [Pseudovibrio sp. Alg231-02]
MEVFIRRTQHPVGQGLFHSSEIVWKNPSNKKIQTFRLVYDCGSHQAYSTFLEGQIKDYKKSIPRTEKIDLLVISHFHKDHISGIKKLLENKTINVETLLIPHLSPAQVILALASVADSEEGKETGFETDFILDPIPTLQALDSNITNILVVKPVEGPSVPPEADKGSPEIDEGASEDITSSAEGNMQVITPNGKMSLEEMTGGAPSHVIDDQHSFRLNISNKVFWSFATYLEREEANKLNKFLKNLYSRLGGNARNIDSSIVNQTSFNDHLNKGENVKKLLPYFKELKAAYKDTNKDLNPSSLMLYSGPKSSFTTSGYSKNHTCRCDCPLCSRLGRDTRSGVSWLGRDTRSGVSWLGTGDADLSTSIKCDDLKKHFSHRVDKILTATVPHHGSKKNSCNGTISTIPATNWIISAHPESYGHPDIDVIKLLNNRHNRIYFVNGDKGSKFIENLWIEFPD